MNLTTHRIPAQEFAELSAGGGEIPTIRRLVSGQRSKYLLLVRGVRDTAQSTGHPQAEQAQQAYRLLAELQDRHPGAVEAVLHHPPVGAWARRTILAMRQTQTRTQAGAAAVPGQLAGLAAAAAIRSGGTCSVHVPTGQDGTVMLPSLGRATGLTPHTLAQVTSGPTGAQITSGHSSVNVPADPHTDAPGWHGLRRLSAQADGVGLQVIIEDTDPCRMPDSQNMGSRLSPTQVQHWQSALQAAWDLLTTRHPAVAAEVSAAITAFTPLTTPERGQVSASSRETFGCIAMSQPRDAATLAVTLTHETQHAKLSALLDIVPLLHDDDTRCYAPWRDDPRPLSGLLQGAYAHLGIAAFWRRECRARPARHEGQSLIHAQAEFTRWREATDLVAHTLADSRKLTRPGEIFVAGMQARLREWATDPVSDQARTLARTAAAEHLARWCRRNGRNP